MRVLGFMSHRRIYMESTFVSPYHSNDTNYSDFLTDYEKHNPLKNSDVWMIISFQNFLTYDLSNFKLKKNNIIL